MKPLDDKVDDFAQEYGVLAVTELYEEGGAERPQEAQPQVLKYAEFDPALQETLFRSYKASGDSKIRNKLFENNKRLVYYTIDYYFPWVVSQQTTKEKIYDNLVSEGNSALFAAFDGYDSNHGAFSTYAVTAIKYKIERYLNGEKKQGRMLSLDRESEDGLCFLDELGQMHDFVIDDIDFLETVRRRLGRAVKSLSPRDKEIIERHYGLDGNKPETLDSMGKLWGITRAAVQSAKDRAIERLKVKLEHYYENVFED